MHLSCLGQHTVYCALSLCQKNEMNPKQWHLTRETETRETQSWEWWDSDMTNTYKGQCSSTKCDLAI